MIFVKIGVQWDFRNYLSIIKIEFSWYLFEAHLVPRSELIVITTSTIFVDSESQKETISRYKATIRNFPRPANDHRIVSLPEEIGRAKPTCRRAGTCSARREFGDSGNRKWCFEAGAGLAEAALAEGAGTAPIVRAVSCYETRRASRERNGELPREEKMAEWREHREREREREREAARRRSNRHRPKLPFLLVLFLLPLSVRPVFVPRCVPRLLFLLLLSFARVLPSRGTVPSQNHLMCLAEAPWQ